jgi:hypothetical protein
MSFKNILSIFNIFINIINISCTKGVIVLCPHMDTMCPYKITLSMTPHSPVPFLKQFQQVSFVISIIDIPPMYQLPLITYQFFNVKGLISLINYINNIKIIMSNIFIPTLFLLKRSLWNMRLLEVLLNKKDYVIQYIWRKRRCKHKWVSLLFVVCEKIMCVEHSMRGESVYRTYMPCCSQSLPQDSWVYRHISFDPI